MTHYHRAKVVKKAEKTKKRLSTPKIILVAVLILLVLLIVGFGVFTLIKLYGMSINHTKIVPKPTVAPYALVTPVPGIVDVTGDPDDLTQDVDPSLDPSMIFDTEIYQEDPIDPNVVNILVVGEDAGGSGSTPAVRTLC